MFKRMINWLIYTVIAGIVPMAIAYIVCNAINKDLSYIMMSSSIFFFDIMLFTDAIKELVDLEEHTKLKRFLSGSSVFSLIVVSIVYGVMLLYDYGRLKGLDVEYIAMLSFVFTCVALSIDFCVQVVGGVEDEQRNSRNIR